MEEELVDIVDEENNVIGKSSRREAHKKGLIHRALSVLVLNSKGKILLQQRAKDRKIHALSWDLSTSEHVLAGESYEEAGKRSLKEELGIDAEVKIVTKTTLQKRQYKLKDKQSLRSEDLETVYDYEIVLMLVANHDGPFDIDPVEVNLVKFFSMQEIEKLLENGTKFTPWFLDEWENVKNVVKTNA